MQLVLLDIDGTVVHSLESDSRFFAESVAHVLDENIDRNWASYTHVTDTGLCREILNRYRPGAADHADLEAAIKHTFLEATQQHLATNGARAINGAPEFISWLQNSDDFEVAFATGGWRASAIAKLEAVGISTDELVLATADDHWQRTRIMQHAIDLTKTTASRSITYFGDGEWDLRACREMNLAFVLVGSALKHEQQITDFTERDAIDSFLGIHSS